MTRPGAPGPGAGADDRGQFVLLAGVVVALALVAMLTAYLQLGYHADVAAGDRTVADGHAFLDRATHAEARAIRGQYDWSGRTGAVTDVRNRIRTRLDALERTRVADGVVYRAEFNATAARDWTGSNCPGGPDREFGPCEADRGVVVQERAGRTLVLAVAYDLSVTTERSATSVTTTVEATG